jgi:hypothetical protein
MASPPPQLPQLYEYNNHHSHSRNPSSPSLSGQLGHEYGVGGPRTESPGLEKTGAYTDSKFNLLQTVSPYDNRSESVLNQYPDDKAGAKESDPKMEVVERQKISGSRKRWMFFVWFLTFWMPSPLVRLIVGSKRKDIREAWREKLAINMMIWFSCLAVIFFMSKFYSNSSTLLI